MKNKDKGLYEQLKNNEIKPLQEPLTKEFLTKTFEEAFKNRNEDLNRKVDLPLEWIHHTWEENGKKFSCWKLVAGGIFCRLITGDNGKEEINKIFEEHYKDTPIPIKEINYDI